MLDFPRWKTIATIAALVVGIWLALPTLVPASFWSNLPASVAPKINLGLDLAGGSHLLLEADAADARQLRVESMERTVRDAMRGERGSDDDIAIGDLQRTANSVSFLVRDATQVDAARDRLNTLTTGAQLTGQRTWDIEVRDTTRVVVTLTEAGFEEFLRQSMVGARDVVERRLDGFGTREPTIILEGEDRIVVQVPGIDDPGALKELLGQTARLEFRMVTENFDPAEAAQGRAPVGSMVVPYANQQGFEVVSRQVMISGDQLEDAQQSFDQQSGAPVVTIQFNGAGATTFSRVTRDGVGKRFAMLVDGKVLSAPVINEPINGGSAQISGGFTVDSANQLAIALNSGALPIELQVVEERTVSPELGADSVRRGAIACVIALLVVMAYMVMTYGSFGMLANVAVLLNVVIIIGIMAMLGLTLSLPGIAGMVLTVGAAVDANVLINERIREELRRGRNVLAALDHGFKEASTAIFDANVTNVIAGALMFTFGSGPVQGFAVVLMIGIITSYFTAVTVTRMWVSHWYARKRPTELVL